MSDYSNSYYDIVSLSSESYVNEKLWSPHMTLWTILPFICWYLSMFSSSLFRLIIRNFWSHETRLPFNTLDRLLALNSLYSPKIEIHFLSLATNFLLEMTRMSPDYLNPIFEHPLSECEFQVKCLFLNHGDCYVFSLLLMNVFYYC